MSGKIVMVFGAGATRACGGPLTVDVLPDAFAAVRSNVEPDLFAREGFFDALARFLRDEFHVDPMSPVPKESYPPLPLLLSL